MSRYWTPFWDTKCTFSKLTRDEENNLAKFTRTAIQNPELLSQEMVALIQKATEPDPAVVIPIVEWAQRTVKSLAYDAGGWDRLFGGLPRNAW